jgi:T-complex protein 1 subunit gamma
MIELSRTQDEEVGDGTTSVIILTAELLKVSEPFLVKNMHPRIIIAAYYKALDIALEQLQKSAITLDIHDRKRLLQIVNTTLGTKFTSRFGDLISNLAIDAVRCVYHTNETGQVEIDVKRYVRVERIVGDYLDNSYVLDGILLNKDVVDAKMKRRIEEPRIVLLDCNLEYKKAESMTNVEITKEEDWDLILKQEEDYIQNLCNAITAVKPDLVITEKGVSELAAHYLHKAGCSVLRRLKKTDNNRIARATGATIVNDPRDLKETDVGTGCGLFEVRKIGDEYYTYIEKCKEPKACTVILRGGSKDILQEIERNLQDAMAVVRNIMLDPRVLAGGGSSEMSMAAAILDQINTIPGTQQGPYKAVANALEVIPRTLSENCGAKTIRLITELRSKHKIDADGTDEGLYWGINGQIGELEEINKLDLWEPMVVKTQTIKTAVEAASMLLRIDAIVSGLRNPEAKGAGAPQGGQEGEDE